MMVSFSYSLQRWIRLTPNSLLADLLMVLPIPIGLYEHWLVPRLLTNLTAARLGNCFWKTLWQ